MRNCIVFYLLLLSGSSYTQISFEKRPPIAPLLVNVADFADLHLSISAFADIDNDGDQDVLTSGQTQSADKVAYLYENNGQGSFTSVENTTFIGVTSGTVDFADIDGDNDQDVFLSGSDGIQVTAKMYVNDGMGNFTLMSGTPFIGVQYSSAGFVDIDNDLDQDLIVSGQNGNNVFTKCYKNDGVGNFTVINTVPFLGITNGAIDFSDVDLDNDLDVLIIGRNGNDYVSNLYLNDGIGTFSLDLTTSFSQISFTTTAFLDLDNDGDEDLVLSGTNNNGSDVLQTYTNNGTGVFTLSVNPNLVGSRFSKFDFADVDNDGDKDFLHTGMFVGNNNEASPLTNLYINNGNGVFSIDSNESFFETTYGEVTFSDVDNDNDPDVLITGLELIPSTTLITPQNIFVNSIATNKLYINDGTGSFAYVQGNPFLGTSESGAEKVDIDNDNDMDVIVSGLNIYNQTTTNLYVNNGLGDFVRDTVNNFQPVYKSSIASSDVDLDNDQDILLTGLNDGAVYANLYINDGLGNYSLTNTPFLGVFQSSVAFSDIDNDGDEDVLITGMNVNDAHPQLYKNNGAGIFTEIMNPGLIYLSNGEVLFADMDNDGDEDLFMIGWNNSAGSRAANLYYNDGFGNFSLVPNTPFTPLNSSAADIADIDNDSDLDVFIAGDNLGAGMSKLYINLGGGNFVESQASSFTNVNNPSIEFVDIDGDLDQDLLISGKAINGFTPTPNSTKLYLNNGSGVFSFYSGIPIDNVAYGKLIAFDADLDNKQDVLVVGQDNLARPITKLYYNTTCTSYTVNAEVSCGPYLWTQNGENYSSSGIYYDTLINQAGCDSLIVLDLTINSPTNENLTITSCDSYTLNGQTYNTSGTFTQTLTNEAGCDSILTLNLTINYTTSSTITLTACDDLLLNNQTYTSSGTYLQTLINSAGCDSIVTLNLTILNSSTGIDAHIVCDSFTWIDGNTYTSSNNTAIFTFTNQVGCDSIVTLNLTILNSSSSIDTHVACDSFTWIDGNTYTSSNNTAMFTFANQVGCDSTVMLNLTINSNTSEMTIQGCDSLIVNGQIYTSSGTYIQTLTNIAGCDSILTLNLIINNTTSSSITLTACDDFVLNNQTYTSSGTYLQTLINSVGCDSIVTLNLTILNSSNSIDTHVACDSFTWIDGNTYTSSNNTAMFTFTNQVGCDSTVMLNLTINSNTSEMTIQGCDSLIVNGQIYTSSGTYIQTLTNIAGCDSILTLNLIINYTTSSSITLTACDDFLLNNQSYTSSGTYLQTLINSVGCDSIVTLNLTIIPLVTLESNTFSMPSDANNCFGSVAINTSGNPNFTSAIDGGSPFEYSGYHLEQNLCPGVHDLSTTDGCGNTITSTFVIPVDTNYVFNNPFIDSIAVDSLGTTIENCTIYYNSIDTAFIDSIWANGNTVTVIWNIVDGNGSNFDTSSYVLNNGNGAYYLQLSVFCPTKALGEYFTVTEAIYFNNGSVSTASLAKIEEFVFEIYPNPTNDKVTLSFEGQQARLVISDALGKLIFTEKVSSNGSISLADKPAGIYFFQLTTEKGELVRKVVKN